MTPTEVYEKLAQKTNSRILGQLYRERAVALRKKEAKNED